MTLTDIIAQYDEPGIKFMESEYLGYVLQCDKSDHETIAFRAECLAFYLEEKEDTGKNKFSYEPVLIVHYPDGTEVASAYTQDITPEIIEYWENRISETHNPILKARYAGLVWEFKKRVTNIKPDIGTAEIHIRSLIEIIQGDYLPYPILSINKAERAMVLSKSLKLNDLLAESKKALNLIVEKDNEDEHIGIWASPFRISMDHPNIYSQEEQAALVVSLQARFDRIAKESHTDSTVHTPNPWLLMDLADALAPYYTKHNSNDFIADMYRKVKTAFDAISGQLSKLSLVGNLMRLHKCYIQYLPKAEADALNLQIAEVGRNIQEEMQVLRHDFTISKEEMEYVVNSVLCEDFEQTFRAFACSYIPYKEQSEKEVAALAKSDLFGISTIIFDTTGRAAAHVGSAENDIGGHLVLYISGKMKFDAVWINATIEEGKRRGLFTIENILAFLHKSPAISPQRFPIIERSLKAYFDDDYLVFIHLVIPQIEAAVRNILECCILPTRKMSQNGGSFQLRILDELLRDKTVQECLNPDFANYLRILLTDNRGWNLRNNMCHGISSPDIFNRMTADRVLHALLCFGLYKLEENDSAESATKTE